MDLELPFRSHHPLRLHENRRRCLEIPRPPLLLHRLRRINPAHRKTSPQHTGPPERHRSRPTPAHAPYLEPRQRRRRLASIAVSARPLPGAQPTRRGPIRPTLPRSLLALGWRSNPLLRSLHPRQTLRPQPPRRKLRQASAHDVRWRRGGHGTRLLVHARRSLLPFRACRHGASAGRRRRGVVAQPLPLDRLRLRQILLFRGALRSWPGRDRPEDRDPRRRVATPGAAR